MQATDFYYVAVGVQAIMVSIFLGSLTGFVIFMITRLSRTTGKIEEAAEESKDAAGEVRDYVGKISNTLIDYLVLKISNTIKKNK